jgi:hypothetical protein
VVREGERVVREGEKWLAREREWLDREREEYLPSSRKVPLSMLSSRSCARLWISASAELGLQRDSSCYK